MLAFGLLLGAAGASAADASFFGLIKLQQFAQAPGTSPAPLESNGFSFQAFVVASTNAAVTNATVAFRPGGVTVTKTLSPVIDGLGLRYEEKFDTQAALDAAYPAGGGFSVVTYTNTLHTVDDGVRAANLTFWLFPPLVSVTAPGVPNVANLNEAQDIDTSSDFTLRWNNLGTVLTLVQLTGGIMEVRLTGATNHVHRIEATDDFARWQTLAETNAPGGEMTVLDPVGPGSRRRFYRGTTER